MALSRRIRAIIDLATVFAIGLNIFVYFYPDILNEPRQCNWHNSPTLEPKFDILENIPPQYLQPILRTVPGLRKEEEQQQHIPALIKKGQEEIHMLLFGDPQINGNWKLTKYIKRLDNYGNDFYLGHIYNTMYNRLHPSHVVVMGDLFSSQWILDSEFYNRTYRFVERLFPRDEEYKQHVIEAYTKHEDYDWRKWLEDEKKMDPLHRFKSRVYDNVYDWVHQDRTTPNYENPLFINLTGNHDIGYSGDATWQHMARFHYLFGQNNYVINYNKGTDREWRIVVVDSLTLEGPALQPEFVNYTWSFLDHLREYENPNFKGTTILLTHIPMYKKAGLCRDGPEHRYYDESYEREPFKLGLLRSQNHLSFETTQKLLNIVFPNPDQGGIILTGHDHEGCDDWYNFDNDGTWVASKTKDASNKQPIREIVVRSMMGDFDGQTGILTGQFDQNRWNFNFTYCSFTVQHWWWASKVAILVAILLKSITFLV